jgi:acetyl esterase
VLWHRGNILDSWRFYLGGAPATPYASPPRAESLAGLPPTYVGVCSTDALRDEGIAFAQRLSDDGVATELVMYPGLFHGAASTFPTVPACQRARAALLSAAERLVARR